MANPTMTLIASNTVGSGGASSVTFSSIPATYTDLVLFTSLRDTVSAVNNAGARIILNGSSTGYSRRDIYGDGSNAYSSVESPASWARYGEQPGATSTANTFSNDTVYIPNYTSSNYKSLSADSVGENNATTAYTVLTSNLWANTAAITSIQIQSNSASWAQYSTFYLYGIKNS